LALPKCLTIVLDMRTFLHRLRKGSTRRHGSPSSIEPDLVFIFFLPPKLSFPQPNFPFDLPANHFKLSRIFQLKRKQMNTSPHCVRSPKIPIAVACAPCPLVPQRREVTRLLSKSMLSLSMVWAETSTILGPLNMAETRSKKHFGCRIFYRPIYPAPVSSPLGILRNSDPASQSLR
jgi:hypothetical protein